MPPPPPPPANDGRAMKESIGNRYSTMRDHLRETFLVSKLLPLVIITAFQQHQPPEHGDDDDLVIIL